MVPLDHAEIGYNAPVGVVGIENQRLWQVGGVPLGRENDDASSTSFYVNAALAENAGADIPSIPIMSDFVRHPVGVGGGRSILFL